MRIAVWHNLPSGGGKRALHDHVAGLVARGHHVESWSPPTADLDYLPLRELCTEHVVPFEWVEPRARMPGARFVEPIRIARARLDAIDVHARACAVEIERGRFDVLFANTSTYFHSPPIGRHSPIPCLLYLQEPARWLYEAFPHPHWAAPPRGSKSLWDPRQLKSVAYELILKQASRIQIREEVASAAEFDRILVNSSFSRESVLRAYGLESRVCPLGIDLVRFRPTGETRGDRLVGLGALSLRKGPDRAVRAVAAVAAPIRPPLLWIGNANETKMADRVVKLAHELGVSLEIRERITDDELVSELSRARAMIYTSRLEPFGLAPLEANACGTPVVAIAEGGIRETVRDGENGFVAPDDDPAALGAFITKLVESRELADDMGRRARMYVESNWSMATAIDAIERHLTEVAALHQRPAGDS